MTVTRRQPLQPLELPSTPMYDPVKLRLIEDAEDWQPRTGTSQSRSFRKLARLTGTDGSKFPQGLALLGSPGMPSFAGATAARQRPWCIVALKHWVWPHVALMEHEPVGTARGHA